MIINHNMNAMNAQRNMGSLNVQQGKAMEKLSSGMRINRASDDAAGLVISEKMRSQIRGLNQASRNAQDGISMIQTAEGALSETHSIGQRMRELAVQSANGTYTDEDREIINQEFVQLKSEIDRIAQDTEFNGNKVLDGNASGKTIEYNDKTNKPITGNGVSNTNIKEHLTNLFKDTEAEELAKIGEGNFEIRVRGDNKSETATFELIDKSHFNGGKEYVMDSYIVTDENKDDPVRLYGIEIKIVPNEISDVLDAKVTTVGGFAFSNDVTKKEDGITLQVGANQSQTVGFSIDFMRSRELGLGGITVDTAENAQEAIHRMDVSIERVSAQRADLGANQNRLEHTIASTDNTAENLQADESRIRDVDMAKEMMNLTKLNVLQQASQSMFAQANQAPQQVLSILK